MVELELEVVLELPPLRPFIKNTEAVDAVFQLLDHVYVAPEATLSFPIFKQEGERTRGERHLRRCPHELQGCISVSIMLSCAQLID